MESWTFVERPGYLGVKRDQRFQEYDRRFGAGRWRLAWRVGEVVGGFDQVVMLYEDAYMAFFEANPRVLEQLIGEASDVYDDAPSNVASGFSYSIQETNRTHIQDIAIRRCVMRLGRKFWGGELIQIRDYLGSHPLSMVLSPGRVPFHRPELIVRPQLQG